MGLFRKKTNTRKKRNGVTRKKRNGITRKKQDLHEKDVVENLL